MTPVLQIDTTGSIVFLELHGCFRKHVERHFESFRDPLLSTLQDISQALREQRGVDGNSEGIGVVWRLTDEI
jgi:hypothetical protein